MSPPPPPPAFFPLIFLLPRHLLILTISCLLSVEAVTLDRSEGARMQAVEKYLLAVFSPPREGSYADLAIPFRFTYFMEGHQRCKNPFKNDEGGSASFTVRPKNVTPDLSFQGKVVLNGKYHSAIMSPSMGALAVLWFAKYLLNQANKRYAAMLQKENLQKLK